MSPSKLFRFLVAPIVLTAALTVTLAATLAGSAFAKGDHPQTHHCKMPDGSMDMTKTHKQCTAAKGTWFKDVPAPGTPAPSTPGTPAPAPAPSKPATPGPTTPTPAPAPATPTTPAPTPTK